MEASADSLRTETKESILEEELNLLHEKKIKLKTENQTYMKDHPELGRHLDDFTAAVYKSKPQDIIAFGEEFFRTLAEKDRKEKSDALARAEAEKLAAEQALMDNQDARFPRPLVVAGPSGVGKGTLEGMLMARFPEHFGFSVSHTTRAPRPGEEEGVQYYFVDDATMQEAIAAGKFVEHAYVHTNYYGTSYEAIENIQQAGKICILDIDIQGVENIRSSNIRCKYLFIAPPSIDVLEARLRARSTETEDKLQVRLKNARGEIAYGMTEGNFDLVVINENLEECFNEIMDAIVDWYPHKNIDYEGSVDASLDKGSQDLDNGGDGEEEEDA